MFTGICNLYGCTRRPKDKEKLLKQMDIDKTVIELNLLNDGLYSNYDKETWKKLNRITELKRKYFNLSGKVYKRSEHYNQDV